MATFHSFIKSGDHLVCEQQCYGGTRTQLDGLIETFGIDVDFVDCRSVQAVTSAIKPKRTKLIWLETPTNPLMRIIDIEAVSKAVRAKDEKIIICVDNTFMTPCFQRPLELGADLSVASLTKYIGGHSDVLMGSVVTNREELHEKLKFNQTGNYQMSII